MPTQEELEFVERYAYFFETTGGTRSAGRLHGWLQICDPPHQSLKELATALAVSRAAVSVTIRQLEQARYVERAPVSAGREHYYQVTGAGNAARFIEERMKMLTVGRSVAEIGLAAIGDDPMRRERLEEMHDLYSFLGDEYGEKLTRRWTTYRNARRKARREQRKGDTR